jgi:hypothetical protein
MHERKGLPFFTFVLINFYSLYSNFVRVKNIAEMK